MIGIGLKNYANDKGFKIIKDCIYGEQGGYLMSLYEGMGTKSVFVNYSLPGEENAVKRYQLDEYIVSTAGGTVLQQYKIDEDGILLIFHDTVGTMKKLVAYLENLIDYMGRQGIPGANYCCKCGRLLEADRKVLLVNGHVYKVDGACRQLFNTPESEQDINSNDKNYIKGTFGAFLGTIVGIIPWIIVYSIGFFVGWLGYLIGFCAKKGYELLGGKTGKPKIWIIVVLSLLGVVFAQFISLMIEARGFLSSCGDPTDLLTVLDLTIGNLMYNSELRSSFLVNLAMGFVFAFLGLYSVIKNTNAEIKGENRTVVELEN